MTDNTTKQALFEYVLRLGENALINGQRLSEWCGHGPFLEEDVSAANTALDLIGRSRMLLTYAGELEGKGRSEDDLAYMRDEREWHNFLIMELPKKDFGFTMVRQFLNDAYNFYLYQALQESADETLAGIAAKVVKESAYHVRHTGEWVIRFGDGTEESHARAQAALDDVWPYVEEMFETDDIDRAIIQAGMGPDPDAIKAQWNDRINAVLEEATLKRPGDVWQQRGGRQGLHTEHMGYLLAEMQSVQRAHPGQQW